MRVQIVILRLVITLLNMEIGVCYRRGKETMDVMPKIGDVKNLKDLSVVLVLPMICACYIYQTDFTVRIDDWVISVNASSSTGIQIFQTVLIFIAKTLFAGIVGVVAYMVIAYGDIYSNYTIVPIVVLVLLTFGFVGIFSSDKIALLNGLKPLWFYTSFVLSFFLLSHYEKVTENT